mgnify:CR=1 FL=1
MRRKICSGIEKKRTMRLLTYRCWSGIVVVPFLCKHFGPIQHWKGLMLALRVAASVTIFSHFCAKKYDGLSLLWSDGHRGVQIWETCAAAREIIIQVHEKSGPLGPLLSMARMTICKRNKQQARTKRTKERSLFSKFRLAARSLAPTLSLCPR